MQCASIYIYMSVGVTLHRYYTDRLILAIRVRSDDKDIHLTSPLRQDVTLQSRWRHYTTDPTSLSVMTKVLLQVWNPWDRATSPVSNKERKDTAMSSRPKGREAICIRMPTEMLKGRV